MKNTTGRIQQKGQGSYFIKQCLTSCTRTQQCTVFQITNLSSCWPTCLRVSNYPPKHTAVSLVLLAFCPTFFFLIPLPHTRTSFFIFSKFSKQLSVSVPTWQEQPSEKCGFCLPKPPRAVPYLDYRSRVISVFSWWLFAELVYFLLPLKVNHSHTDLTNSALNLCIIGSAEALPILCVRYFRWERERDTERERERDRDGSDVTIFALKLAMNLHFPCQKFAQLAMSLHFPLPKIRTFRFSLHTSRLSLHGEVTWRWNSQWVHTFHSQKLFRPLCSPSFKWHEPRDEWLKTQDKWSNPGQSYFVLPIEKRRRVIENPRQMIKSWPVLFCSSHRKNESN